MSNASEDAYHRAVKREARKPFTPPTFVNESNDDDTFGAVIIFRGGMSKYDAEQTLKNLVQRNLIHPTTLHSFNAQQGGGPVWYIP
jgi:hypothetical protein